MTASGALMDVVNHGASDTPWDEKEAQVGALSGLWSHSYQLWTSRDKQHARWKLPLLKQRLSHIQISPLHYHHLQVTHLHILEIGERHILTDG